MNMVTIRCILAKPFFIVSSYPTLSFIKESVISVPYFREYFLDDLSILEITKRFHYIMYVLNVHVSNKYIFILYTGGYPEVFYTKKVSVFFSFNQHLVYL